MTNNYNEDNFGGIDFEALLRGYEMTAKYANFEALLRGYEMTAKYANFEAYPKSIQDVLILGNDLIKKLTAYEKKYATATFI